VCISLCNNIQYHKETGANSEYDYLNDPNNRKMKSLHRHRTWDVRNEQRATFLARAFLQGKPYKTIESKCDRFKRLYFIEDRVLTMVNKYGKTKITKEQLIEWFKT